jgi:hypothetical protein
MVFKPNFCLDLLYTNHIYIPQLNSIHLNISWTLHIFKCLYIFSPKITLFYY